MACAREDWARVEPLFYETVDRLFSNYQWPKPPAGRDRYVGFASILYRFPRNIAEKQFWFPANPLQNSLHSRRVVKVIAHEMLHFMEYEYMEKRFGLQPSEKGSADNIFWQFTENLNVLIENSDQWSEITRGLTSGPYPECQELYDKMKVIWGTTQDIDLLLREIFKEQVK